MNLSQNITIIELFEIYIQKSVIHNLSKATIKTYTVHFNVFKRFLNDDNFLAHDIDKRLIELFILDMKKRCTDITINSYLRSLRAFLYYAMEEGYIGRFKIRLLITDKKIKETYSENELKILLGKPDLKKVTFSEYKIWALSNYLLGTGNRISSALSIKIKDLEFDNLTIQINHSKNRRAQIIPMSPFLATILKEYLIHRKGSPNDYVFCNSYGEQGNIHTYQTMIYKYNRSKGIDKTSAHLYRHTFAKRWILNGGDIFRLQKILGHSDLSVVKEYVNMFSSDLSIGFDKYNPLDTLGLDGSKCKLKL